MLRCFVEQKEETAATSRYEALCRAVREVLHKEGCAGLVGEPLARLQRARILETMERFIVSLGKDSDTSVEQTMERHRAKVAAALVLLPRDELRSLLRVADENLSGWVPGARVAVKLAYEVKAERLALTVNEGIRRLRCYCRPQIDNIENLTREIASFGRAVVMLREDALALELHTATSMDGPIGDVHQHLLDYLSPTQDIFPNLDNRQLNSLVKGMDHLGEGGEVVGKYRREAERRRRVVVEAYVEAVRPALDAILKGSDIAAFVAILEKAESYGSNARVVHAQLGNEAKGEDDAMVFRENLLGRVLQTLDSDELTAFAAWLESPVAHALIEALDTAGRALSSDDDDATAELGKGPYTRAVEMRILQGCVQQQLEDRNIKPYQAGPERAAGPIKVDVPDVAKVLRDVFGVSLNDKGVANVCSGPGTEQVQGAIMKCLRDMLATFDPKKRHVWKDGTDSGVDPTFIIDLPRADYSMKTADGVVDSLYDRTRVVDDRESRAKAAIEKLRTITGDNLRNLQLASYFANQSVFSGLQRILLSAQSPVRLPDGRPGCLVGGVQKVTYQIADDADGGLLLSAGYTIRGATHFMPPSPDGVERGNDMVLLDVNHGCADFTFALRIDEDGDVRLSAPLVYNYDVMPGEAQ
ncbi:hypothetical protein GCM10027419_12740 [Pandoraea terrae]